MNSTCINAGQPEICLKNHPNLKKLIMEKPDQNPDIVFDEDLYTIEWSDIEHAEMDYENYLNDIENFFREDFEEGIPEENIQNTL